MASNIVVSKDGFLEIDDFKDWIDVTKVVYYSLKVKKDGILLLKFYDKKKKLVKPYKKVA